MIPRCIPTEHGNLEAGVIRVFLCENAFRSIIAFYFSLANYSCSEVEFACLSWIGMSWGFCLALCGISWNLLLRKLILNTVSADQHSASSITIRE